MLDDIEVEASFLAEEGDKLEATLGVDDLPHGGVDCLSQGRGAEDGGGLSSDISIDVHGCLRHDNEDTWSLCRVRPPYQRFLVEPLDVDALGGRRPRDEVPLRPVLRRNLR